MRYFLLGVALLLAAALMGRFWLLFLVGWFIGKAAEKLLRRRKAPCGQTSAVVEESPKEVPQPLSAQPDGPVPFGYKTAWLAIRCDDPRQAAEALHCRSMELANWATGLLRSEETGGALFCAPVMDGFVLAIGQALFSLTEQRDELETLAGQFPEVQYFASHRVSSSYCWARYEAGRCMRAYGIADGEVLWNTGELTPQERSLGFDAFPVPGAEETDHWPDEEDVLDIAAAWGIDPRFETKTYPPSADWICG